MGSAFGSKASFLNLDQGGLITVQFNPKEFKINDKANWKASDEHEATEPLLTYEKGDPTTVSMELIFDGTDSGMDVYAAYVEPLRGFLSATVDDSDSQGNKMKRPPYCLFSWGGFEFDCVVESLNSTAIMFDAGGGVLRARVSITLKQRSVEEHMTTGTGMLFLSSMGSLFSGSSAAASTAVVQPGQTLTSIAPSNWREVAAANGISDPTDLTPGQQLVIPLDSDLAAVLSGQFMSYNPNKWVGGLAITDYSGAYTGPRPGEQVSSAFEDSPSATPADVTMYSAADAAGGQTGAGQAAAGGAGAGAAGGGRPSRPRGGGGRANGRTAFGG